MNFFSIISEVTQSKQRKTKKRKGRRVGKQKKEEEIDKNAATEFILRHNFKQNFTIII
jgi:hypothetical protein